MPKHTERKYKVDNFDEIIKKLSMLDAKQPPVSESHHYYAKQDSLDVTKLVVSSGKSEIHILKEKAGTFTLTDRVSVTDKDAGIAWLEDRGFKAMTHIKMVHTDYEYAGGIVGLYIINDSLHSVILDYPIEDHTKMAHVLGLENAEVIEKPYNQYVELGNTVDL